MSGKLFSIKADPMVPHCTHDSFRSMKLRWYEGEVIVVPSFLLSATFPRLSTQRSIVVVGRYFIFLYVNVSNKTK